ncbi:hypothetical protein BDP27DRAFT_1446610 [Rhodocollybia butyracea]|uniref:RNA polymerase II elongation factor ELL N-terminal domain-containing protein n=1 Tax=Rhodocollybia butyracea TaxID=206335 RepID=A0A9P5PXB8_9AGAR|nr:hypothetical protein BDP27DRAFT_1446610 [Rhodocollybia butyracea]
MLLSNATYTLQGQSRPGEPMYSRPKHGMLLRLSMEAMNALQSDPNGKPKVDFVVGEDGSSRIVIGESHFPLQSQTEEIPHDLYLRSASAMKPSVPLKFYANVVGRLTISSERELSDELANKIHEKTAAAAERRNNPRTRFLDANELPPTTTKTKKKPDIFRKPVRPSDQAKPIALSASTSSSSALSPRPSQPSKQPQDRQRQIRLIHYLATAERTTEDAVKAVGGSNADTRTKQEILDTLSFVAEQVPATKGSLRIWRLKNESWLEVRPYEWPRLSESERTNMARASRRALKALGIPENDPKWEHARYRPPANPIPADSLVPTSVSASTSQASTPVPAPKRGISSKEAREKKVRKTEAKTEVMIKDETKPRPSPAPSLSVKTSKSSPAPSSSNPSTPLTPTATVALRRQPGSGYKLPPKPVELSRSENKSGSSSSSASTSKEIDVVMKDVTRRPAEAHPKNDPRASTSRTEAVRASKEDGELSTSSSGTGGIGVHTREDRPDPVKRVKRLREEAIDSDRESDKGRDRPKEKSRERLEERSKRSREKDRDQGRERPKDVSLERENHKDRDALRRQSDMSALKRKKVKEEEEEESIKARGKRRKTEDGMQLLAATGPSRERHREPDRNREREQERGSDRERDKREPRPTKLENDPTFDKKLASNSLSVPSKTIKKEPSPLSSLPLKKIKKEPSPLPPPSRLAASTSSSKGSSSKEIKKELSPLPPPLRVTASTSSIKGSASKTTKLRRKSPIYTSSEDEADPGHSSPPIPSPPTVTSSSSSTSSRHSHSHNSTATEDQTLANGHDANHRDLRTKYTSSYMKYLGTLQALVSQRNEIERLLAKESGSRSDSDGDIELLDYEGLSKIMSQNKQQWEELQSMQLAHERGTID